MSQLALVMLALFDPMERTYAIERAAHDRAVASSRSRRTGRPSVVDPTKLAYAAPPERRPDHLDRHRHRIGNFAPLTPCAAPPPLRWAFLALTGGEATPKGNVILAQENLAATAWGVACPRSLGLASTLCRRRMAAAVSRREPGTPSFVSRPVRGACLSLLEDDSAAL